MDLAEVLLLAAFLIIAILFAVLMTYGIVVVIKAGKRRERMMAYKVKATRNEFARILDDRGVPKDDRACNGGAVPKYVKNYGVWLRTHDPASFDVLYQPWRQDMLQQYKITNPPPDES